MTESVQLDVYHQAASPIHSGVITASTLLNSGDQTLIGFSAKETTGTAPAECWLVDGNDGNGNPVAFVTLQAGQSVRDVCGPCGVACLSGLAVRVLSGSVQVVAWVVDL